jgi:hypothetical protein
VSNKLAHSRFDSDIVSLRKSQIRRVAPQPARISSKTAPLLLASAIGLLATFAAQTTFAQTPNPQQGSSTLPLRAQDATSGPRPIFEFHSGFWLNLHHFLYQQARVAEHLQGSQGTPAKSPAADANKDNDASPAWQAAIAYYRKNMAHRDLLFDQSMVLIGNRLADIETCPDLSGRTIASCTSGLQPNLISALEGAAPIYRTRWWPEHDRANRDWIDGDAPLVRHIGLPLAQDLSAVYEKPWQREPIRVDVVIYAGPFGAYTSLDPTHITVASSDPRNEGLAGFEILFHEASHALAVPVQDAIAEDCRLRDIPIPRDLWHALLFYTTGEMVRRAAAEGKLVLPGAETKAASYTPYAYRNNLYSRGWEDYLRLLEAYWQPYLDGRTDFEHAIRAVVAGL